MMNSEKPPYGGFFVSAHSRRKRPLDLLHLLPFTIISYWVGGKKISSLLIVTGTSGRLRQGPCFSVFTIYYVGLINHQRSQASKEGMIPKQSKPFNIQKVLLSKYERTAQSLAGH